MSRFASPVAGPEPLSLADRGQQHQFGAGGARSHRPGQVQWPYPARHLAPAEDPRAARARPRSPGSSYEAGSYHHDHVCFPQLCLIRQDANPASSITATECRSALPCSPRPGCQSSPVLAGRRGPLRHRQGHRQRVAHSCPDALRIGRRVVPACSGKLATPECAPPMFPDPSPLQVGNDQKARQFLEEIDSHPEVGGLVDVR